MKTQREIMKYISTLSLTSAVDMGGWSTPGLCRFTSGKETRYPSYIKLRGPQDRSGWVQEISPPQGFDLRTAQPVASSYTDWITPAHDVSYPHLLPCACLCTLPYSFYVPSMIFTTNTGYFREQHSLAGSYTHSWNTCEERLLASSCFSVLPVYPNEALQLSLYGFSWRFTFRIFLKALPEINSLKLWQNQSLHMRTHVNLWQYLAEFFWFEGVSENLWKKNCQVHFI